MQLTTEELREAIEKELKYARKVNSIMALGIIRAQEVILKAEKEKLERLKNIPKNNL